MSLPQKNPLQQGFAYTQASGQPTQSFAQYMQKLDALVAALAAGVEVGSLYRNGSVIQVRVV
jgi:hypothetical protein